MGPGNGCREKEELLAEIQSSHDRLQRLNARRFEAANAGLLEEVELLEGIRRRELNTVRDLEYAYKLHVTRHGC